VDAGSDQLGIDVGASGTVPEGPPPTDRRSFRRAGLIALIAAVLLAAVLMTVLLVVVRPSGQSLAGTPSGSGSGSPGASDSAGAIFGDAFDADLSGSWQPVTDGWSVADGELVVSPESAFQWKTIMLNRELPTDVAVSFRTKASGDGVGGLMLHASGQQFVGVYLNQVSQRVNLTTGYLMADGRAAGGLSALTKRTVLEPCGEPLRARPCRRQSSKRFRVTLERIS